jgi:hypothetical protein
MNKRANTTGEPDEIIGQIKEMILDPITMLLWKLLAVSHDIIHDFGLNIDRMSSIVLYINHMVEQLGLRTRLSPQDGGFITRKMINAEIQRRKKKGLRLFNQDQATTKINQVYEYADREYTDREEIIERNAIKEILLIQADMPGEDQFELQYQQILNYNSCVAILNNSNNPNSGRMLELFVHMNQLIEQIKLFVVFQIFDDHGIDGGQHPDITRERVIASINGLYNLIRFNIHVLPEFSGTKDVILEILQMMKHIYIQLSNIQPPEYGEMNEREEQAQFDFAGFFFRRYKQGNTSSLYLDLFKGPLLHNILRIFLLNYFRVGRNVNNETHIAYIVTKLLIQRDILGGGARRGTAKRGTTKCGTTKRCSVRHHYKMYGGSMLLSTFRTIEMGSRNDLADTLIQWESVIYRGVLPPPPPNQLAQIVNSYIDFFKRMILPSADAVRQLDPRLIRKLNIVTFGKLKDTIPLLHRKYLEQVGVAVAGNQLIRMTRGALTDYGVELVKKMNDFMNQTKTDFDGLIAEEVAANEADAAAAAAAPVPRQHRIAVQRVSLLIAKKGLQHARDILTNLNLVVGQQPHAMLPQLDRFLPLALNYIGSILLPGPALAAPAILMPAFAGGGVLPTVPKEYDKYNNLMFELYLLGLIYRHTGNGGLPDIDSRLIDYYRTQYLNRANVNGEVAEYTDLVFCDNLKAQTIFQRVKTDPRLFRVINNSVSRLVKELVDESTACPSSSKCDAMGSFGGCSSDSQRNEFCSMGVVIRDNMNVSNYMALTEITQERGNYFVKVVNQFNLGGLVVNSTHSRIDLQTNPTILSANNVFKKSLDLIVTLWKSNPAITPDDLWASLELDDNFKSLMDSMSQKGIGDIYQELNSIIAEAGYTGNIPQRIFTALQKITVGLAGDRPSAIRMMILLMYAPLQDYLMRYGRVIVGYGNDTNSFLVGHRDCIPLAVGPPLNPRKRGIVRVGGLGSLRRRVRTIKNKIYKNRHNKTKKRS